ncbi:MAG: hypothetical protein M5U01_28630 [Ardenticatenaceae bacterium]|nr:hypothetical protein [Ardenticatenaceae bacterium]
MDRHKRNRWKGFISGALGGVTGVLAMRYYRQLATAVIGHDPRQVSKQGDNDASTALDSISLIGTHHKASESSTAAVGRIAFQPVTGHEPQQETKTTLSYIVHWIISLFARSVYGALRGDTHWPDVTGGLALAVGLWSLGDELAIPLLGLASDPTASPLELHAHAPGAHLAYGLAAGTQTLDQLFE